LRELWLRADAFTVTILDERYERVVTHATLYGEKQEAFNWYLYLPTIVKRPNALKYVAFYDQLPVQWKEFFERSDRDGKKAGLKLLSKMLSESDMATATRALIESDSRDMKVKVWTNSIIYIPVIWFFVRLEQLSQ